MLKVREVESRKRGGADGGQIEGLEEDANKMSSYLEAF